MRILVTGGTVFVSRFTAEYFALRGHDVTVMNRGSRPQVPGVRLLQRDRLDRSAPLRHERFDAVLDITAYHAGDVEALLDVLPETDAYIMISSSAVYPQTLPQPFREDMPVGPNCHWGAYGEGKIAAEALLHTRLPGAYVLRPPYLYGPWNNVYREAFVFECAEAERPFFLPGDGEMGLQLLHVRDLCRLMERILEERPEERVFNCGNPQCLSVRDWVVLCYGAVGREPHLVSAPHQAPQRSYFPFLDYAYRLDVSRQQTLLPGLTPVAEGLRESYAWFRQHRDCVRRKPLMDYIDRYFSTPLKG